MDKIKSIIKTQRSEPNLAEDLKIPAYIKMKLKFTEPAAGTLAINIEKNKEPLRAKAFTEPSYIWEAEFGLMDYQYQGILYVNPENYDEYSELRTKLEEIDAEVVSNISKKSEDMNSTIRKEMFIEKVKEQKEELLKLSPTYEYLVEYIIDNNFVELADKSYKLTAKTFDVTPYIKLYEKDKIQFNMEAFRRSNLTALLERKYSFELEINDRYGNKGTFTEKNDRGIQTNTSTPDITYIINIILISIILIALAVYFFINIINMKKKFMLKESLPPFLANIGIIIFIINIIASLFLKFYPVRLEFFLLMLISFFLLSEQGWALKFSGALSGSVILIGLISVLTMIFPEIRTSFTPSINPDVPSSFFIIANISIITYIFVYILTFACSANMFNNNLGAKRNKSIIISIVIFIVAAIVSVVTGLLSVNMYHNLMDGSLYRSISLIAGSGAIGVLLGSLIPGEWGKSLGRIMFILLGIGFVVIMIFGFVPFKLQAILLLASFLIIGTTWARTVSIAYFFVQAFILIFTFIILIPENYSIAVKISLLIMGIAYVIVGLFNVKSVKIRDYSEGKL